MISVIVTTYNKPVALKLVLQALDFQDTKGFEVIVADDGSTAETADLIKKLKSQVNYHLEHIWQEDKGFRAAKIRNKAAAVAKGDYLVFLDGDSIPRHSFVRWHNALAKRGFFVAGNRILFAKKFTQEVLKKQLPVYSYNFLRWILCFSQGSINRLLPLISLGCFYLRGLKSKKWQGAKTCNLGIWKKDFYAVNGFDETYRGWGYEDSDLVVRLFNNGVLRRDGCFATGVLHLWHQENNRSNEAKNLYRLNTSIKNNSIRAEGGVNQYLQYPD